MGKLVLGRVGCGELLRCMTLESAVLLEGAKFKPFDISQGVAQGCSLSPILFSTFINELLNEVVKAGIGKSI